jgi:hypothetical protein
VGADALVRSRKVPLSENSRKWFLDRKEGERKEETRSMEARNFAYSRTREFRAKTCPVPCFIYSWFYCAGAKGKSLV